MPACADSKRFWGDSGAGPGLHLVAVAELFGVGLDTNAQSNKFWLIHLAAGSEMRTVREVAIQRP